MARISRSCVTLWTQSGVKFSVSAALDQFVTELGNPLGDDLARAIASGTMLVTTQARAIKHAEKVTFVGGQVGYVRMGKNFPAKELRPIMGWVNDPKAVRFDLSRDEIKLIAATVAKIAG